jgi:predicted RNase H-like HicB family nuclease
MLKGSRRWRFAAFRAGDGLLSTIRRGAILGSEDSRVLTDYIQAAMGRAEYERMEDGAWFARIPGFDGLWASGATVEATRQELRESLEDWLLLGLRLGHALPVVDGLDLNAKDVA